MTKQNPQRCWDFIGRPSCTTKSDRCLAVTVCVSRVPAGRRQSPSRSGTTSLPYDLRIDGKGSNDLLLLQSQHIGEEVGGPRSSLISDLNGPLYILDKETKSSPPTSISTATMASRDVPQVLKTYGNGG